VKVGVQLPTFRAGAADALAAAHVAATSGLDGVFAYDHLWPMGHPERPSLAPFVLLSTVGRREPDLFVAPLVARVGLVGTALLVEQFLMLDAVSPGRVIAALGTGDKLSVAENDAYGLARTNANERRSMIESAVAGLAGRLPLWVGAGAPATNALAASLGATLNFWEKPVREVADADRTVSTSWAGNPREDLEVQLDELEHAGATWAVFAPNVDVDRLGRWRSQHDDSL
jgi:alkanesulfonate monooxygenase SsuD/methylene tetrahydromethanopterin reductase-like flavin-dependent oxidoreductase (luciferase family)